VAVVSVGGARHRGRMLVRADATYLDDATKQVARVFPTGSTWLHFDRRMPGAEVFANSVLEPAIGLGGDLALRTFANADWQNWTSSIQIATFELANADRRAGDRQPAHGPRAGVDL
jgi:hypothetical protein